MSKADSRLAWALRLARCGFSIFPILPGTKSAFYPGESQWPRVMSRDEATIRRWFAEREGMNYGVCPGDGAGVVDLDRKPQKDGIAAFELLALEHDGDPGETFVVESASGGRHLYFRTPFRASNANRFPDGIDTRGGGGYVVGPGSELIAGKCDPKDTPGRYEVVRGTPEGIAPAPPWILESWKRDDRKDRETAPVFELDTPAAISRARELLRRRAPAVEGQGGDEHTYATFCLLRDCGVSEAKAVELAAELWNDRCAPPWDIDGPDSLSAKAANAYRYAVNRPASKGGSPEEVFGEIGDGEDMPRDVAAESKGRWSKLRFTGAEMDAIRPLPQLIENWLPATGVSGLIAYRSHGKTVLLVDLGLCIATDRPWHGHQIEHARHVIYLAGEDQANTISMIRAWCRTHDGGRWPERFHFYADCPRLMAPEDVEMLIADARTVVPPGQKVVVFIDTWQRATTGISQVDEAQMSKAAGTAEFLGKALGDSPVVIAFHPPKGARFDPEKLTISGAGVIENITSSLWHLFPEPQAPDRRRLKVDRIKGPGVGSYKIFKWREVALPEQDQIKGRPTLKGVIPECVGGSVANVGDDFGDSRLPTAEAIRDYINSPARGKDQGSPSTINKVREDAGIQGHGSGGTLTKNLRQMFQGDPCELGDGTMLKLDEGPPGKGGAKQVFKIVLAASGDPEDEGSDNSD